MTILGYELEFEQGSRTLAGVDVSLRAVEWLVRLKPITSIRRRLNIVILSLITVTVVFVCLRMADSWIDLALLLFGYPLLYAAIVFRVPGISAVGIPLLALLIYTITLTSSEPVIVVRGFIYATFSFGVCGLTAILLNYGETQLKLNGSLQQLHIEVDKLKDNKDTLLKFLGVAAHDMKTPLAVIQSYLEYIQSGYAGRVTRHQRETLLRCCRRSEEMIALINDLLDIPRLETGRLVDMKWELCSLKDIVYQCTDELSALANANRVQMRCELPELPKIDGSERRLKQVVTNLLSNAIHYTPGGNVTVSAVTSTDMVTISITDDGIGIPPADQPYVFDDFFRASNTDKKGTGLGLAIARRIVEAHGGTIGMVSPNPINGKGCIFSFSIPLRQKRLVEEVSHGTAS